MFLSYYKVVNKPINDTDVICVLGRTSLTSNDKSIGIKNQILVPDENGNFNDEGARLLQLSEDQDLIEVSSSIDPDIAVMSRSIIYQLRDYKINNPQDKATLLMAVKRYTKDFMYYLDWEDRYVSIMETDPTLIGKTYIEYKITEGSNKRLQTGSFEVVT